MFGTSYNLPQINYRSAEDLNSAMGKVYAYMGLAVVTSLIVSMIIASSPTMMAFLFTGVVKWIVIFAPLVAIFAITSVLNSNPSATVAHLMLHGFAALIGVSFATIFTTYKLGSVSGAFMGAAILFSTISFYGYFTKKSLDSVGKWCIVGLIAIIIAGIINIFVGNSAAQMIISAIGIIIFLGLTAWDTQRIRNELAVNTSTASEVSGALSLYLNFINIFLNLLTLFGNKDE